MRIAGLIIGLLLGLLMFLQSLLIAAFGDGDAGAGGALGLLVAIMWLISCGLVIGFPLASTIGFIVAALFAMIAATTGFSDMGVWAGVSLVLAVMSFFGWRGKRSQDRERDEERHRQYQRDQMLLHMMQQQRSRPGGPHEVVSSQESR